MLALINAERIKVGARPLVVDIAFQTVAHARTADMLARNFASHDDPVTGERLAKSMLAKLGVTVPSGENFYWGWPYRADFVEKAHAWYMSDPPHRDNIISRYWTVIGVSVMRGNGDRAVTVTDFGAK
jgi:uncharacterized protein YkwD